VLDPVADYLVSRGVAHHFHLGFFAVEPHIGFFAGGDLRLRFCAFLPFLVGHFRAT
jgi:hypothetical protein